MKMAEGIIATSAGRSNADITGYTIGPSSFVSKGYSQAPSNYNSNFLFPLLTVGNVNAISPDLVNTDVVINNSKSYELYTGLIGLLLPDTLDLWVTLSGYAPFSGLSTYHIISISRPWVPGQITSVSNSSVSFKRMYQKDIEFELAFYFSYTAEMTPLGIHVIFTPQKVKLTRVYGDNGNAPSTTISVQANVGAKIVY